MEYYLQFKIWRYWHFSRRISSSDQQDDYGSWIGKDEEGSIAYIEVKWSRYRPGVAQRAGRGIALPFHDCSTRGGWVVSSTPRPHFTPGKDPVPILQEAGWAPGPVWMGGKSRPHRDSILDNPACSQSLYRLTYLAHVYWGTIWI